MNDVEQQWPDEPPQQWPEDVADWPNTASTVQGGVVSPQVRCDNCNTVVTQGEAKTLFCSGQIDGVQRHIISLCPSCVPTKKEGNPA